MITDVTDDKLTDDELVGMAFLLLIAGHSTTAAMISSATLKLMRRPHLLATLRDDPGQFGVI